MIRSRHIRLFTLLAFLSAALPRAAAAGTDALVDSVGEHMVIYLGSIAIDGQRQIFQALQDIKVALEQPLSSDPRLADVMVCRLADELGSRSRQVLICGTNRSLARNRELMHTVIASSSPAGGDCGPVDCGTPLVGVLDASVNSMPHLYLMQQVNGPSLQALLASIPYPAIGSGSAKPAPWLPRAPSPSICGDARPDAQPAAKQAPRLTDCLDPTA
jgi:hypothetical protein